MKEITKLLALLAFYILILVGTCGGWVLNAYKLTQLDFEPSYKAESIRVVGVFVPISVVTGWITFDEEKESKPALNKGKE